MTGSGVATSTLLGRVVMPPPEVSDEAVGAYVRGDSGSNHGQGASWGAGFQVTGRLSMSIDDGSRVVFDSFFNAFPASHWRRWTSLEGVELRLSVTGVGKIDVYRSGGSGRVRHESSHLTPAGDSELVLPLPIAGQFGDGGSYWFAARGIDGFQLRSAQWHAATPLEVPGATIGICTFNRPDDCVATLRRLIDEPQTVEHVRRVVIVDQGTRLVQDHPQFAEVAQAWGGRVEIVPQPNLGGSGGFSRAMYETLQDPDGGDVILTDDDIRPEPESFLRATMFAAASQGRCLVHGHMLDLFAAHRLHNTGDMVDHTLFRSRAVNPDLEDLDLSVTNLTNTPALSRRTEGEFGGWWMCLVPRPVMERLGLAMPVFIKWDDVEFGMRAYAAGVPTVTLPGAGVWHQPFYLKDVETDWTAYFEWRNRLVTALVYGTTDSLRTMIKENTTTLVKHALTMNYSAMELHAMAVEDVLAGPQAIAEDLPTVLGRVREARARHIDARVLSKVPVGFRSTMSPASVAELVEEPRTRYRAIANVVTAVGSVTTRTLAPREGARADLSGMATHWAALARLDEAVVSSSDGVGISVRRRDSRLFKRLVRRLVTDHAELLRRAPELQETYRRQFPAWVSVEAWSARFGRPT